MRSLLVPDREVTTSMVGALLCFLLVSGAVIAVWGATVVQRQLRRQKSKRMRCYEQQRCTACGYDIHASIERCPECGAELVQQGMAYWRERFEQ